MTGFNPRAYYVAYLGKLLMASPRVTDVQAKPAAQGGGVMFLIGMAGLPGALQHAFDTQPLYGMSVVQLTMHANKALAEIEREITAVYAAATSPIVLPSSVPLVN